MDDNYLDEVLPRWQFWKEYLIEQLGEYRRFLKEDSEVFEVSAEILEETKKVKTAKDLRKITEAFETYIRMLELSRFCNIMNQKINKQKKQ